MKSKLFFYFFCLILSLCSQLCSMELVVWNRYLGADLSGTDAFISTFYCTDSAYSSFSISSGRYDGDLFTIDSPNRTLQSAGILSEGDYTIELVASNGSSSYKRTVQLTVGPAKVCPQIATSASHTILLTRDGDVYTAGNGNNGQLGNGSLSNPNDTFTQILSPSVSLDSGDYFCRAHAGALSSCLVTRNGKAYFAGAIDTVKQTVFTLVEGAVDSKRVVQAVGGQRNQYFLCDDGTIYSRGSSADGALGDGNFAPSTSSLILIESSAPDASSGPLVGKLTIQINAAENGCLLLNSDSTLYGWGGNRDGLLGLGDTRTYNRPNQVTSGDLSGKLVNQIVSGVFTSLLYTSDGTILGSGANSEKQLALGDTTNRTTFNASSNSLFTTHPPAYIACSHEVAMMLSTTGSVIGWGNNTHSVTGGADPSVLTILDKTVTSVASGNKCALYLANDGTVIARGESGEGVTGYTSNTSSFQEVFSSMGAHQNLVNNHLEGASHVVMTQATHFSISWSSYEIDAAHLQPRL